MFTTYIRTKDDIKAVMLDVIIALVPAIIASVLVYGLQPLIMIVVSILSAVATEKLFSLIFYKKSNSINDLSAIITGILLPMTLGAFTPIPVVAFGASMAIIFGKLIFGGIGKNKLNPAIVGREFMTIFFPIAMAAGSNWYNEKALKIGSIKLFGFLGNSEILSHIDGLILDSSGILGGYSVFALVIGGIYLVHKNRVSWHISVSFFLVSFLIMLFYKGETSLPLGGLLLTGIFMATDMPSSPSFSYGKIYYGIMLGVIMPILWKFEIFNETLSYIILIMNIFSYAINQVCRPVVFGYNLDFKNTVIKLSGLTVTIMLFTVLWALIHNLGLMNYLVYGYILFTVINLVRGNEIK